MRLKARVDALESRSPPAYNQWVRVMQYAGQSEDQAIAAHEIANGSLGNANLIIRRIVAT